MGQTETKVAQVTLKNESGRSKTISIDRPKDDLSLNQIETAFLPAISGGWLLDNSGDVITEVSEAKYSQVIKTQINGEPVVISPSSLEITIGSNIAIGSAPAVDLTVSNGVLEGIVCPVTSYNSEGFAIRVTGYTSDMTGATIGATRLNNNAGSFSGVLQLMIKGSNTPVTVPISVTQELRS